MNKRITALAALLLISASVPGAAEAAGIPKMSRATFMVTVDGVQRNSWTMNHVGSGGGCDGSATGQGSEVMRFTSKPVRLRARYFKGLSNPVLTVGRGDASIPISGKVTRDGVVNAEAGECGGTGGGETVPPDCGTKRLSKAKVTLDYLVGAKRRLKLSDHLSETELFRNCPTGGFGYPTLLTYNTNGEAISSLLPNGELFNRSIGKIILIGRGKNEETTSEGSYTSTVRWVVTFERLGLRK